MSISQHNIMARLLTAAQDSKLHYQHASAICAGKKIYCININSSRTKFGKEIHCCGHSEITCIQMLWHSIFKGCSNDKINRKMKKLTLYIARRRPTKSFLGLAGSSGPCSNCLKKINKLGIKKIVYCDREGNIISCKTKNYISYGFTSGYNQCKRDNIRVN